MSSKAAKEAGTGMYVVTNSVGAPGNSEEAIDRKGGFVRIIVTTRLTMMVAEI